MKGDKKFTLSNKASVEQVKLQYLTEVGLDGTSLEKIRLFCLGKELKDDLFLYSYDIGDDLVMQAMIKA